MATVQAHVSSKHQCEYNVWLQVLFFFLVVTTVSICLYQSPRSQAVNRLSSASTACFTLRSSTPQNNEQERKGGHIHLCLKPYRVGFFHHLRWLYSIFKHVAKRYFQKHAQLILTERLNTEAFPTVQQEYGKAAMLMLFLLVLIKTNCVVFLMWISYSWITMHCYTR